jgi:hypothetical protein
MTAPNYPAPNVAAFNWNGQAGLNAGTSSTNVQLPATPGGQPPNTTVIVTNTGTTPAFIKLGADNTVAVTTANGFCCPPNVPVALALNGAAYLAGITGSGTAQLAISVGR